MSTAVPLARIATLVQSIDVTRLSVGVAVSTTYAGFATQNLIRMHLLPYVLPLKSERALAFEVAERPQLQAAVGLIDATVPSRATLWHFRRRNQNAFKILMTRALALLAFEGSKQGIDLPFVSDEVPAPGNERRGRNVSRDVIAHPASNTSITVLSRPHRQRPSSSLQHPRLPGLGLSRPEKATRALLHESLDMPLVVQWQIRTRSVERLLVQPSWLDSPYSDQDLGHYFGRDRKTPYTACNVIVLRKMDDFDEVLLTRRLRGSGAGTYALPGGKKYPAESVVACAKRELHEEVGIEYRAGRVISRRVTRRRGFPPVTSIGVLATDWRGTPRRREHLAHSRWSWYRLAELPSPLFFPTELALRDYLTNKFPDLEWDAVEDGQPLPLWKV